MSDNNPFLQERRVAVARWADRYTARFDQGLTDAWPDLADRLRQQVAALSWYELTAGPGPEFRDKRIQPAVQAWVERHVRPIIEDADRDFPETALPERGDLRGGVQADAPSDGALCATDVLKGMALPGGVLVGGGAVVMAITTATTWFVFTTMAVNWPLLIAGLLIGAALSWFGVVRVSGLGTELQRRFEDKLLPPLREAVIGAGAEREGKRVPSLKDQLKQQVRDRAEAARRALERRGRP
jgi:hypothetical protein